jgi:hypothetical protein
MIIQGPGPDQARVIEPGRSTKETTVMTEAEGRHYDPRRLAQLLETGFSGQALPPAHGGEEFRLVLSFALAFLPRETVDNVLNACCYAEINAKLPRRHFSKETVGGRYLIVILTDEMAQKPERCVSSILWETAHYLLGHHESKDWQGTESEGAVGRRQAACSMAINWLLEYGKHFPGEQTAIGEIVAELRHV